MAAACRRPARPARRAALCRAAANRESPRGRRTGTAPARGSTPPADTCRATRATRCFHSWRQATRRRPVATRLLDRGDRRVELLVTVDAGFVNVGAGIED